MKSFKVLGSGCKNCVAAAKLIEDQARDAGVEIELEKVTDMAAVLGWGIMSTPGVVLNGVVVHSGGVPSGDEVRKWLTG